MENLSPLEILRKEFGLKKDIPKKYEQEILTALSYYPELKNTSIQFVLAVHAAVPYGTKPTFASCFKLKKNRIYTITILEVADLPVSEALLKKLTESMRISVIGHELAHVKQFENCNPLSLIKTLASFAVSSSRRKLEREADKTAIKHGLGSAC